MSSKEHDKWMDDVVDRCMDCEHLNDDKRAGMFCTKYNKACEDVEYCSELDPGFAIDYAEYRMEDR